MAKTKTVFYCAECGNETLKWQGQCPACGAWNTIAEHEAIPVSKSAARGGVRTVVKRSAKLSGIDVSGNEIRTTTGLAEFDRVLGGGAVTGSLILVGGEPGIGKSTLLLQLCGNLQDTTILYVTGEESERQLKLRADRLKVSSDNLFVFAETNLSDVIAEVSAINPDALIIDSIQTLYNDALDSAPGSVGQVKDCTMSLMRLAKSDGITVYIVGHVNKEGSIAGPKVLEHMVDCVLYFEGERTAGYRLLRSAKNRFGSTNEIGVFEMTGEGLVDVPNPSELLLSGRPLNAPGTCVTCLMEGSRPLLAEIQALVSPTNSGNPRRNSNGFDYNRAALLLAVLEKRGGLRLSSGDVFINVIGGLTADEPAVDLAVVLALASCFLDVPAGDKLVAIGEVGLTGELRSVSNLEQRLNEAKRLGFTVAVVPKRGLSKVPTPSGLRLIEAANIRDALTAVLGRKGQNSDLA
ncbi:MAG: DNA repair protein RadA [Oscillospiraceae bacterium]|jgi:DNA repair protein RadA/Sms|nr:DNA repair protein RadA [Oscillospiraceae bacterium]